MRAYQKPIGSDRERQLRIQIAELEAKLEELKAALKVEKTLNKALPAKAAAAAARR